MPSIYTLSFVKTKGAENIPLLETNFLDADIDMDGCDALVFTSKNGVLGLDRLTKGWRQKPSIAIGAATAKQIEALGGRVSLTSSSSYGDDLAEEIGKKFRFLNFLYPRAKEIASNLPEVLRSKNIAVTEKEIYETVCSKKSFEAPKEGSIIVFSSPSTVKCFYEKFGWNQSYKCVAIGKTTALAVHFTSEVLVSPTQSLESAVAFAKTVGG